MKILVAGLVESPQLVRLKQEARKKGHELEGCFSSSLIIETWKDHFEARVRGKKLTEYDLIYLWTVSKRRWEWYTAAIWANRENGTKVINQKVVKNNFELPTSSAPIIDYYMQVKEDLPFPKTMTVLTGKNLDAIEHEFKYPIIVKSSLGSKGQNVYKAENRRELKEKIKLSLEKSPSAVVREFIPNEGDIRIYTVGFKAVGAMKRIPPKGDFRANISQGGTAETFDLKKAPDLQEIAEKASKAVQVEIAGVDIILHKETGKPYILEVNPGPQFIGLEKFTGTNVAGEMISYFEKVVLE